MTPDIKPHMWMPVPWTGCWLWTGRVDRQGRARSSEPGFKSVAAARLFYKHYVGPIGDDLCVCHRCDEPACVNPDHLFLGTRSDNMRDMVRKHRHKSAGVSVPREVYEQVAEALKGTESQSEIAARFGVSQQFVYSINLKRGIRPRGHAYPQNKLGVRGVYVKGGRYVAQIRVNKRAQHLGYFDTIEAAQAAYEAALRAAAAARNSK